MDTKNRKTRSFLINPRFQWTLIGYAASGATLILLTIYGLISYGFHRFVQVGTQLGLPPENIYFEFITVQEKSFNQVILAIALAIGMVLIVGGLVISHKIAGPIHRMKKELRKMQESDPPALREIQFRKGDFFPELAESFNELVRTCNRDK
ncbi:hypothetical protein EB061_02775 [bacterium]|jgi:hypothetical protein|nr:hypothetical protein [bacterium]